MERTVRLKWSWSGYIARQNTSKLTKRIIVAAIAAEIIETQCAQITKTMDGHLGKSRENW